MKQQQQRAVVLCDVNNNNMKVWMNSCFLFEIQSNQAIEAQSPQILPPVEQNL